MSAAKQKCALSLLAVALIAAWQYATVHANYGGNWTALFCTGALEPHPPLVAREHVYLFPNSTGYDGQMYHYVAHDPFLPSALQAWVDNPRLRYRRILMPALVFAAALGRSPAIDRAYELVFLVTVALGVWWSCGIARKAALPAAWGLVFLAMPAVVVGMDRLVVDSALAALAAAFLYYSDSFSWRVVAVLACAALARETGLLFIAAYSLYLLSRRAFRPAILALLAVLPAAAWYARVQSLTAYQPYVSSLVPFSAIARAILQPVEYPPATPFPSVIHLADLLALAGMLLAFAAAVHCFRYGPAGPTEITALAFAAVGVVLQRVDLWQNVYDYGRIFTPLLLCLAVLAAQRRRAWLLAPLLMLAPRLAIQLAPQALGIVRRLPQIL